MFAFISPILPHVNPTPRQKQILDFVTRSIERRGFAPSIQEICDHFHLASTATVHKHLKNLAARGLLTRESHRSRALEVPTAAPSEAVEIPLLGRVAAGVPIEAIANPDFISVPKTWLGRGETFALRVRGDSMIDAHIEDGDLVVVDRKDVARDGETVIALVDEAEATLKVYRPQSDGRVRLEPRNEALQPMVFDAGRVRQLNAVGIDHRVICNQGGKGAPVRALLDEMKPSSTVFVDDLAFHHKSVARHAPEVARLHMISEPRVAPNVPPAPYAHARIDDWSVAVDWVLERLGGHG